MFLLLASIAALLSPRVILANSVIVGSYPVVGEAIDLANLTESEAGEWLDIPLGNYEHKRGMQVVDKTSADAMLANFAAQKAKKGARFAGIPIYLNHPDVPEFANQSPDKKAKGWVSDMQVTDTALRLKAELNAPGKSLLANKEVRFFSPVWSAEPVAGRTKAYRPVQLRSIGLTNDPQIDSCQLPNEAGAGPAVPPWLTEALGLSADASEDDHKAALAGKMGQAAKADELAAAHQKVKEKADEADKAHQRLSKAHEQLSKAHQALTGQMANEAGADPDALLTLDFANTLFAAERHARAALLVDSAITAGRITLAEKDATLTTLANAGAEFDARAAELAARRKVLPTGGSHTANLGERKEASDRAASVLELVNERMGEKGETYDAAFAAVKKAKPELFAAMQQPGKA